MRFTLSAFFLANVLGCNAHIVRERRQAPIVAPTASVPDYFQLTPEIYIGPTATGAAPFLAQTNPAPFEAGQSFVPNAPLETAEPIVGNVNNGSIFQLMGNLSPYFPNPAGFGAQEYPLPKGANITQVHMLSRHGSRYPQANSSQATFGASVKNATASGVKFTGALSFLNSWSYTLGAEILVHKGHQELFDSGVLHYYDYGALYNPNTTIVARTTTQKRMRESAEYFLAGFFGLNWEQNPQVKLEFIIEGDGFNDSLVGAYACPNTDSNASSTGSQAGVEWQGIYLKSATQRLNALAGGYNWTIATSFAVQQLCAYETVALGYSSFCDLFTFEEWQGFEYVYDMTFAGNSMFQSPTGRAVGVGYVQEFLARLEKHCVTAANSSDNVTLDSMPTTFPLNQSLYFDFSHDSNIASVLAAFGLTQFSTFLPPTGPPQNSSYIPASHYTPFGARLDIEIISTPHPVSANRSFDPNGEGIFEGIFEEGPPTQYVHFLISQRTLPLGRSFDGCGDRLDGWCEMEAFLGWQRGNLGRAEFERSCFGEYEAAEYGEVTDGVPVS